MGLPAKCSDDEFVALWNAYGPTEASRRLGVNERSVYKRKNYLAQFHHFQLPGSGLKPWPGRVNVELRNGTALIGSDFHIWPGQPSTCLRAFKKLVIGGAAAGLALNGCLRGI